MDNQSSKEKYSAIEVRRLYDARINLIKSSNDCAKEAGIEVKKLTFSANTIIPRFKPKRTQNIIENI
jgi:hypothetical protein